MRKYPNGCHWHEETLRHRLRPGEPAGGEQQPGHRSISPRSAAFPACGVDRRRTGSRRTVAPAPRPFAPVHALPISEERTDGVTKDVRLGRTPGVQRGEHRRDRRGFTVRRGHDRDDTTRVRDISGRPGSREAGRQGIVADGVVVSVSSTDDRTAGRPEGGGRDSTPTSLGIAGRCGRGAGSQRTLRSPRHTSPGRSGTQECLRFTQRGGRQRKRHGPLLARLHRRRRRRQRQHRGRAPTTPGCGVSADARSRTPWPTATRRPSGAPRPPSTPTSPPRSRSWRCRTASSSSGPRHPSGSRWWASPRRRRSRRSPRSRGRSSTRPTARRSPAPRSGCVTPRAAPTPKRRAATEPSGSPARRAAPSRPARWSCGSPRTA